MEYRIRKGLDLRLAGAPLPMVDALPPSECCYIRPTDYRWLTPKMLVQSGDSMQVGTPLFADKSDERIVFVSPVEGTVCEIVRGEKRVVECIILSVDRNQPTIRKVDLNPPTTPEALRNLLLQYGLWPAMRQRPFSIIARPEDHPKALFIPCFDSAPLAPSYKVLVNEHRDDLLAGLRALRLLVGDKVPIHLCMSHKEDNLFLESLHDVQLQYFTGPHPAGNLGPQIHRISPLDKGDIVWYIQPWNVAQIGRLLSKGELTFNRIFALTGPAIRHPHYYSTTLGMDVSRAFDHNLSEEHARIISGNVLTGADVGDYVTPRFYDAQLTLLPEGGEREILGWLRPNLHKWSFSHTFLAWLVKHHIFNFNTSQHGDQRNFVMTGVYDKVFPYQSILPLELLKACKTHNIELMEDLGIYEVDDEDFALCEVVCPSKMPCQEIIREGLREILNENR